MMRNCGALCVIQAYTSGVTSVFQINGTYDGSGDSWGQVLRGSQWGHIERRTKCSLSVSHQRTAVFCHCTFTQKANVTWQTSNVIFIQSFSHLNKGINQCLLAPIQIVLFISGCQITTNTIVNCHLKSCPPCSKTNCVIYIFGVLPTSSNATQLKFCLDNWNVRLRFPVINENGD